jgi:hypothetical protein
MTPHRIGGSGTGTKRRRYSERIGHGSPTDASPLRLEAPSESLGMLASVGGFQFASTNSTPVRGVAGTAARGRFGLRGSLTADGCGDS